MACAGFRQLTGGGAAGAERLPKLRSLSLEQNPIEEWDLFVVMCCLAVNPQLLKVNGRVVTKQQRQLVLLLDRPVTRIALRQGWILSTDPHKDSAVRPSPPRCMMPHPSGIGPRMLMPSLLTAQGLGFRV